MKQRISVLTKKSSGFKRGDISFFRRRPSEVGKNERFNFIAIKTADGTVKGKISFYCKALEVSRQGFLNHIEKSKRQPKYQAIIDEIKTIINEDECNDTYGRERIYLAFKLKEGQSQSDFPKAPSEATVRKIMLAEGLIHKPKRKPNGLTKADKEAHKSDDLIKRDPTAEVPCTKCVTDITELACKDGKLYRQPPKTALGLVCSENVRAFA